MLCVLRARFPFVALNHAADGEEALLKVGQWKPNLVFMDISLPRLNGLELTRIIKRSHKDIAVAVLTWHDVPEYRQEAARSGADHFLVKDAVTNAEIFSLVDGLLAARFRALIVGGSASFRDEVVAFLSDKWPAMVVATAEVQNLASETAKGLKPNLVVLGGAEASSGSDGSPPAADTFAGAVIVSVGYGQENVTCPWDFCLPRKAAAGPEMASIINRLVSTASRLH